jgi:D-arabinose 1-dehydrogenase-like Zn-dependent alcohol dehydrogenase
MVVNQDFVLNVPDNISLAGAAPLMCAGITVCFREITLHKLLLHERRHAIKALYVATISSLSGAYHYAAHSSSSRVLSHLQG